MDEDSPLQYVDPYALTKDLMERMGQMYGRRGMTVTALRFHWILTTAEVRELADAVPDEEGARDLWGYVDLHDAARACVLGLRPRADRENFEVLLIAASDTRARRSTEALLDRYSATERRCPLPGTTGAFDCSRAARVLGWTPQADWRTG
ncbi:MAG: NAD-dependent epimerase/dehydratase family protein [Blastococcus sp.]